MTVRSGHGEHPTLILCLHPADAVPPHTKNPENNLRIMRTSSENQNAEMVFNVSGCSPKNGLPSAARSTNSTLWAQNTCQQPKTKSSLLAISKSNSRSRSSSSPPTRAPRPPKPRSLKRWHWLRRIRSGTDTPANRDSRLPADPTRARTRRLLHNTDQAPRRRHVCDRTRRNAGLCAGGHPFSREPIHYGGCLRPSLEPGRSDQNLSRRSASPDW
jgi:hypothetical protein